MRITIESKNDIRIIESEYNDMKAFFINNEQLKAIFLNSELADHQKNKCIEIFYELMEQQHLTGIMKELYDVKLLKGD